jgi:RHS repeat-associated protein
MTDEAGNTTIYTPVGPDRLQDAQTVNSTGTQTELWHYAYDAAGNRTLSQHTLGPTGTTPASTSYAYNTANQMCWSTAATSTGACSCPTITTCTTTPSGATAYAYDVLGQRKTSSPAAIPTMAYDLEQRVQSINSTAVSNLAPSGNGELVGFGTTGYQNNLLGLSRTIPATGTPTDIIRTPNGGAVAQRTGTTNKQAIFTDALGSTIALADINATTITRNYAYTPDGVATTSGSGATTDIQFAGGHSIAGLYHFGARYYDPNLASWTQPDPLNQINSLTEANHYAYARADPVDNTDLVGLFGSGSCNPSNLKECKRHDNVWRDVQVSCGVYAAPKGARAATKRVLVTISERIPEYDVPVVGEACASVALITLAIKIF